MTTRLRPSRFHYLKGMLFCQRCHRDGRTSRLIYTEVRGRNGDYYAYFVCRGRQDGVCDLPYLPVAQVECGIERDYLTLRLDDKFIETFRELLVESMNEQQANVQFLHDTLRKQLAKLDIQEERLLGLAADDAMPKVKIKGRLNKLAMDRNPHPSWAAAHWRRIEGWLRLAADLFGTMPRAGSALPAGADEVRRLVNETFNERYYIDDHGEVAQALRKPPLDIFPEVVNAWRASQERKAGAEKQRAPGIAEGSERQLREGLPLGLDQIFLADVSSKANVVGVTGFEPATSSSRTKRATKLRHTPMPGQPATGPA
jgi:site-specific DNA recombinase